MRETFMFSEKKKRDEIYCEDIVFFESRGHYILVHMKDRAVHRTRSTMAKLLCNVEGKSFVQTHRAFAVNMKYVHKIEGDRAHLYSVWDWVPVSRTYRQNLTDMLVEII